MKTEQKTEKKVEACETFDGNAVGDCRKCGHEESAHTPHSERQARAQLSSICEMVANLTREGAARNYVADKSKEELIKLIEGADMTENVAWDPDEDLDAMRETVAGMIEDETLEPSDFEWDEDDARQTIEEDALSVQVRSGWYQPGSDDTNPQEFEILLCTGGPAVRIIGDLDRCLQPDSPRIQHQDWGTPWTELVDITSEEREALLTYCQQFYFGE